MTVGADNFADAPEFPYNGTSDPTPSAGLTLEPGEPDIDDWGIDRTAWWQFTAPATETVGLDLMQSALDPANVFSFDPVIHVYTGTSLGGLTGVAYGDDNDRMTNPDGSSKYGYLTEMDFEASSGVTYYVRVACYVGAPDMVYLLRLGKRVYVNSAWVERADTTVPINMMDIDEFGGSSWLQYQEVGWNEAYETWVEQYGVTAGSILPTPAAIQAHLDPVVAAAAGFTYLDNFHYESDPGSGSPAGQTSSVEVASFVTPRPDIPDVGTPWFDWHFEVWGTVQARSYKPARAAVIGVAEVTPPPDPEAVLVEYESTEEPVIDSTLIIDRWEGRWQVDAGGFTETHPAVPGTVEFLILNGDYQYVGEPGAMDWATWNLDESEAIARFHFTGGAESQTQTGTVVVPNGVKPDGTFVVAWRVLSLGTLMQADKMGYVHHVRTGTSDYPYFKDSLFPPIEPMIISYTVRNISPYRYVYPIIGDVGVLKVMVDPAGATEVDRWQSWGFPNETPGAGKILAGDGWHVADDDASSVSGQLKIQNELGVWQHVSWMSPS